MPQESHDPTPAFPRLDQSVNSWDAGYLEGLYQRWVKTPDSVPAEWQQFFRGFDLGFDRSGPPAAAAPQSPAPTGAHAPGAERRSVTLNLQRSVDALIEAYRTHGHLASQLDPLGFHRPFPDSLRLEAFDLSDEHLPLQFETGNLPLGGPAPLSEILEFLEETYCRTIGAETAHLPTEQRRWLEKRMEACRNQPAFPVDVRKRILEDLCRSEQFESFCHTRFVGKRWFGIEGGDSLIPMLSDLVERCPTNGVSEIQIGMAHRGRLSVQAHVIGKLYEQLFTEFDESWEEHFASSGGDVKYHAGYSADRTTSGGQTVHLSLCNNASHLEFVDPVVLGRTRAKQDLASANHNGEVSEVDRSATLALLMHGDAALPGQGVVTECLNLWKLAGYTTGGTLHVVINNQIGFTTRPECLFSGEYCTDLARGYAAPIFHVNADDPEGCVWVMRLAAEFRQAFAQDVFVDLVCWRKNGHNETDEPNFTQPVMYQRIKEKPPAAQVYRERLLAEGVITPAWADTFVSEVQKALDAAQVAARERPVDPTVPPFRGRWAGLSAEWSNTPATTAISAETLKGICGVLGTVDESVVAHRTVAKVLQNRAEAYRGQVDWATAEAVAFGSLLQEGHSIRLAGQDVQRGTFSHRHAVVNCQRTGESHLPLARLGNDSSIEIINSPLTECAVVGFEYGFAMVNPQTLVLWEAQFGDFSNAAQVIIDQFISSAEAKWQRSCGMVMLLPHGYEGQGPEHSSCRLERYLQLAAQGNIQVCVPSTAAQYFHVLRRQMKRAFRKPLIVLTPKSLLRLPAVSSSAEQLTSGSFQTVIGDQTKGATRVVICCGKFFHEASAKRTELGGASGNTTVALVRLEQLHPFPAAELRSALAAHPGAEVVWGQEEPENMGAWRYVRGCTLDELGLNLGVICRPTSPSASVGSHKAHTAESARLIASVFAPRAAATTAAPSATASAANDRPVAEHEVPAAAAESRPKKGRSATARSR